MTGRMVRYALLAAALVALGSTIGRGNPVPAEAADQYRVFLPVLTKDTGPGPTTDCAGPVREYLNQPGGIRWLELQRVPGPGGAVLQAAFEFSNPCPFPVAAVPLPGSLEIGGVTYDITVTPIPSIIPAGGVGYFLPVVPDFSQDLSGAAQLSIPPSNYVPEHNWAWQEMADIARRLTIDANGNDATMPEFDPYNLAQPGVPYEMAIVGHVDGQPLAWPPYVWWVGRCDDGTLSFGRSFPDQFGWNTGGDTFFEGYWTWTRCVPERPSEVGPWIDLSYLDYDSEAPRNFVALEDPLLTQITPATFELVVAVHNRNTVPGRPGSYTFNLARASGPPLQFAVNGTETWFPGIEGHIVIRNVPGDIDDFTSVTAQAVNVVAFPDQPVAGWSLPPTYVWDPDTGYLVDVRTVAVPNGQVLADRADPSGDWTVLNWFLGQGGGAVSLGPQQRTGLDELDGPTAIDLQVSQIFDELIAENPGLRAELENIRATFSVQQGYAPP